MADSATIEIKIPILNFDIVQGQDLDIPIKYETVGVPDTLDGADLKMEVRLPDFSKVIDTLTIDNGRIVVTDANSFTLKFPSAVSSAYKPTAAKMKYIHALEITVATITKRMFEGAVTLKREQVK